MVSSNVLLDSIQIEIGGENEWPDDAKLFQPYETEQILMPDSANCLAVQAFLQMANLKYETVYKANAAEMSPTGRVPFIKVGQYLVAELEPIVAFVQNKNISLTGSLTDAEKSDMRAYMSLINTVFGNAENYVTWCDSETYNKVTKKRFGSIHPFPLNHILLWKKRSATIERMKALGGKTEQEAVLDDVDLCCQSLSDRLGERDFFFKSGPTELDCLLYAHVSTILSWPHLCTGNLLAQTICKYPKLISHCVMMKKRVCLQKSDVYGPLITVYNNICSTSKKKQISPKNSLCQKCKVIVANERKSKDGPPPVILYANSDDSVKSESCTLSSLETSDSDCQAEMQFDCQRCGVKFCANKESSSDATFVSCPEKKGCCKKALDSKPKQATRICVKENKNNKNASFEVREVCTNDEIASNLVSENESSVPSSSTSHCEARRLYSASKSGTLPHFDSLTLMNCPQLFSVCGSIMDAIRIGSSKTVTTNNPSSLPENNCRSLPVLAEARSKSTESCDDPSSDKDDSLAALKVCTKIEKVDVKMYNNEADQKPCIKICRPLNGESSSTSDASVPSQSSNNCAPSVSRKKTKNDSSVCIKPKSKIDASCYNNSKESNHTTKCRIPTLNYKKDNSMPDKNVALNSGKQDSCRAQQLKSKSLRSLSLEKCLDRAQRKRLIKNEVVAPKFHCKREGTFSVLDNRDPSTAHSSVSSLGAKREFKKKERCALSTGKKRSNDRSPSQNKCDRSKWGSGTNLSLKKENSMHVNQTSSCSMNLPESKCGFAQIAGMVRDPAFQKKAGNSSTAFNPSLINEESNASSLLENSEDPPCLQVASNKDLPRNLSGCRLVIPEDPVKSSCELELSVHGSDDESSQSEKEIFVTGMCDTEGNKHKKAAAKITNIPVLVKSKLKKVSEVSPRVKSSGGGKTCGASKKIPLKDIKIKSVSYSKLNVKRERDVYSQPSSLKDMNIKSSSPSKLGVGSERNSKLCPVSSKISSTSKLNIQLEKNSNLCTPSTPFKLTVKQERNSNVCPTPSKKLKTKNSSCSKLDSKPKKDVDLCRFSSKDRKKSSPCTAVGQNSDDETCLNIEAQVNTSDLGAETNCIACPVKKLNAATLPRTASKKDVCNNSCQIVTKTCVFSSNGRNAKQFVKTDVIPCEDKPQNQEVSLAKASHAKSDECDVNSIFMNKHVKNISEAESTQCELDSISSSVLKALPADDSNSECDFAVEVQNKPASSINVKVSDEAKLESEVNSLYPFVEPSLNEICSRRRSVSEKCVKSDSLSVTLSCSDEALVSTSEAKLTSASKISVHQNIGERLNIAVSENLDERSADNNITSTPVIHIFENQKAKSNKHAEDKK